jgi:hypothetical protein
VVTPTPSTSSKKTSKTTPRPLINAGETFRVDFRIFLGIKNRTRRFHQGQKASVFDLEDFRSDFNYFEEVFAIINKIDKQ